MIAVFQFSLFLGELQPESEPEGNQMKCIEPAPAVSSSRPKKTFYNGE